MVECHSGYDYAERPVAFYWDGQRIEVETILAEWRTPNHKGFRVQSPKGRVFELFFDQVSDTWEIVAM